MIYIFDKKQAIIKVLTNDDFTAAHLNFKINTATTFEFSLPASKALPSGSKYVATPHPLNDSKFIMLRLTERVDNTETIDYSAYELAYQELATDGYIEDKRPQNQSALNLMKIALDGSNWELNNVNVSGAATTNFYYVDRLSAISKVVDLLGGEIVFYIEIQGNAISGRYMDYLARQGADTSKVFASGSNLLTVERQSDTSGIYTAILPRGKGKEIDNGEADTPDGYGRRINIADVEWKKSAGKPLDKPKGSIVLSDPDATAEWGQINGNARLLLQTYDDIDDVNVLINSAYKTLQSVNHPQIQYSATVADVGGLSLGDTVLIMHGDRDLSYKTRVFEVKYDLLSPDQTELSLGDDLSSNSITSQINSFNAVADTTSSQTQWTINQIGRTSTTYGETAPDSPKVGDIWFKYLPDGGTEIYRWNGEIWELLASPTTADDIAAAVDDAVTQAKAHTDEVKQGLSSDISTAKSQATSQANSALASAKSEATSLFNQAQNALSDAKTDLTNSIASEASARNQAVAAANSQAQNYVNQAKSDITDTINAISVGSRNLLLTSSTMSNTSAWVSPSTKDGETYQGMIMSANTAAWSGPKYRISDLYNRSVINENDTYTYSAFVRNTSDTDIQIRFYGASNTTTNFTDPTGIAIATMTAHTDWTRLSVTFKFKNLSQIDAATIRFEPIYNVTNGYVNQSGFKLEKGTIPTDWTPAPEDVVLDYTTKDNKIKETISQYQYTNDGHVSKAQTDATTALGLVETKVSLTVYDQKTGDLSTKINDVKDTADKSAQTIADIQEADGKRDSRISEVEKTAGGITSTVSDLSTAQEKQSGSISTLQQRADGFDATVTKVNNFINSQGQINQLVNTEFTPDLEGWNVSGTKPPYKSYVPAGIGSTSIGFWTLDAEETTYHRLWQTLPIPSISGGKISLSWRADVVQKTNYNHLFVKFYDKDGKGVFTNIDNQAVMVDWDNTGSANSVVKLEGVVVPDEASTVTIDFEAREGTRAYLSQPMLVFSETIGDYVPGNYNNNYALAKVKLTADQASLDLSTYKTDADGRISKAQADIVTNANAITQKVSQTDYDNKTGDLSTKVSTAQQTADGAVTTIGNYQTSNDKRVQAAESNISQNAEAIALKVSKTDYDNNNSQLSNRFTKVEATANGASTTVGKLQIAVNNLGQVNQLFNTEFTPDLQGWTLSAYKESTAPYASYVAYGSRGIGFYTVNADASTFASLSQTILLPNSRLSTDVMSLSWRVNTRRMDNYCHIWLVWQDKNGVSLGQKTMGNWNDSTLNEHNVLKWENISIPVDAKQVDIRFETREGTNAYIFQPMVSFTNAIGTYVPGNYNNNAALAQVKITADNISNFVRDASGNLSSNFQTALSRTSIITGSTLASSIKTQTTSQISSALTDNNGKIISLINQDSSGVQIAGENIVLDGNTTVTGDFYAKAGTFITLSASKLTAGEIDANKINIINLDASSINAGNLNVAVKINANSITTGSLNAKLLVGDTAHLQSVDTGGIVNRYDYHLQISAYGLYNQNTQVGQLNLHSYKGNGGDWDDTYTGSITYHFETSTSGQNTGLRFWRNHIMSLNKDQNTALYLNPYAGTQVRVTSRTNDNTYYAINASAFNVASDRRFKSDIKDYEEDALEIIKSLRIRKYKKSGKREIGIIADEANDELLLKDKNGDFLSLYDYISIAVKAIQEQNAIIEDLIEKGKEDKTE